MVWRAICVLRVRCVTSACDSTHIQTPEMLLYGEAYEKCSKSHLTASRNLLAGSLRGYGFMSFFKDAKHLFVFAGLFVLAFLVFLVVRHYVVPKSFGEYGHYRGASIGEIAARPIKFAGHQACESGCSGREIEGQTCARELRSLPRGAGKTCRRSIRNDTCSSRHGSAVRPLSYGQRS